MEGDLYHQHGYTGWNLFNDLHKNALGLTITAA